MTERFKTGTRVRIRDGYYSYGLDVDDEGESWWYDEEDLAPVAKIKGPFA